MSALAVLLILMARPFPPAPSLNGENNTQLSVRFDIGPVLQAPGTPPTLKVRLKNTSTAAIAMMRFASDACFAHFYLEQKLTLPDGTTPVAAECPAWQQTGEKAKIPGNRSEERVLSLATLYPGVNWGPGRYHFDLSWNLKALEEKFGPFAGLHVTQWSQNVMSFDLAPPLGGGNALKAQVLTLSDGARFSFTSHGHKRMREGDGPGPLMVSGAFAAPSEQAATPFDANVTVETSPFFRVRGYVFELLSWEYDQSMTIRYFGKLAE